MKRQYADRVQKIVCEAFEIVCYMFPLEPWEAEDLVNIELPADTIKSVITFEGAATGGMVIHPSLELLEAIATNMSGSDKAATEEKEAALCEMTNIICGNTVPLFSKKTEICSLHPPRILSSDEGNVPFFEGMENEYMRVYTDEGLVDIYLYYSIKEECYD